MAITMEELRKKAQRYDEALEKAKRLYEKGTITESLGYVFPELKESEGERIRKELMDFVVDNTICKDGRREKWIAWLEKQGEPIDKIEPKFHKGEWVVWQNKCYKVNYNGCGYELIDQNGLSTSLEYGTIDENAHLWTIADAKEGDVLAISWQEDNNIWEQIIIFKKYHNKGVKGLYYMPCVEGYGNTFKDGKVVFHGEIPFYSKTWTVNLYPATKEKRNTLIKAMTDAGWEFDFEKKELKKLSQQEVTKTSDQEKDFIEIPFGAKDSEFIEATYFIPEGYYAVIVGDEVVIKKGEKPAAWSEEDEKMLDDAIGAVGAADYYTYDDKEEIKNWLFSLKQRIGG